MSPNIHSVGPGMWPDMPSKETDFENYLAELIWKESKIHFPEEVLEEFHDQGICLSEFTTLPAPSSPRANITTGSGEQLNGSGFAMANASEVWAKTLPNIELDPHFDNSVWEKILCLVHQTGDAAVCGPRHHDATALREALESIQPKDNTMDHSLKTWLRRRLEQLAAKLLVMRSIYRRKYRSLP